MGHRSARHLTPADVIAKDSPLWQVFADFGRLGIGVDQLLAFEPGPAGQGALPGTRRTGLGRRRPRQLAPASKIGCWATTEPGHGTDQLDPGRQIFQSGGEYGRPDCVATLLEPRAEHTLHGPLETAPHPMTGPAADVPPAMTVRASCVREVTPSLR
jgi:hypothetical protein